MDYCKLQVCKGDFQTYNSGRIMLNTLPESIWSEELLYLAVHIFVVVRLQTLRLHLCKIITVQYLDVALNLWFTIP